MNGLFLNLENKDFFCDFIRDHYKSGPSEINAVMGHSHVIDDSRLEYAHSEYVQNVNKFSVLLHSKNLPYHGWRTSRE